MTTFFVIYVIYALVVLVSCSWANAALPVQYVSISKPILDKWILGGRCPIVLELCCREPSDAESHDSGTPLIVAPKELASLVRWLPPASLLVIQSSYEIRSLDREVESVLVDLGILVVYWVPEEASPTVMLSAHT